MKVFMHQGLLVAVLTRNEHCPPHVHVGPAEWQARFEFSFWHTGVRLWDVVTTQNQPSVVVLERLRQAIKLPAYLRRARECWWQSQQTVCLVNQAWDDRANEVVAPRLGRSEVRAIQMAVFDAQRHRTILQLEGVDDPVEIEL